MASFDCNLTFTMSRSFTCTSSLFLLVIVPALSSPSPPELQAAVNAAVLAGSRRFVVPSSNEGGYFFGINNFTVTNAIDFELDGANASFWFAPGYGVMIIDSQRVVVHDFTIDYYPLAFAQGRVVSVNVSNSSFVADFLPPDLSGLSSYALPDSSLYPWFVNGSIETGGNKVIFWDPETRRMLPNQTGVCLWNDSWPVGTATLRYGLSINDAIFNVAACFLNGNLSPAAGALVTVNPRCGFAFQLINTSGSIVSDVTAYGAGSMAFAEFAGEGGNEWSNLLLTRRPNTSRLLSANADGFQSSSVRVGPYLHDSELAFIGDDFLNVHSRISVILSVGADQRSLVVVDTGGSNIPGVGGSSPGDDIALFFPYTIQPIGRVTVAKVSAITDPEVWAAARALPTAMNAPPSCPSPPCVRDFSPTAVPWNVTLNGALTFSLPLYALAQALAREGTGARIIHNHFHDGFDHFASVNAPNSTFSNNLLERPFNIPSITVGPLFFWMEGALGLSNVTIANNTLIGGGTALTAILVQNATNVSVYNNSFK